MLTGEPGFPDPSRSQADLWHGIGMAGGIMSYAPSPYGLNGRPRPAFGRAGAKTVSTSNWQSSWPSSPAPAVPAFRGDSTFAIGGVFRRLFSVLGPDFVTVVALIALFAVPERIAVHTVGYGSPILETVDKIALAFCGFGLQLAVMHLALRRFAGRPAGFASCVGKSLTAYFPAGLVYLISILPIALAMLLAVAPGVMLLTSWAVILPVCLAEEGALFASFGRSAALTRGHRWKILAAMLLLGLPLGLLALAMMPIWGLPVSSLHAPMAAVVFPKENWLMRLIVNAAVGLLLAAIYQELVDAKG